MGSQSFFCEFCGAPVSRNANRCPSCGRFFNAVRCPSCGFEGEGSLFSDGCPSCGYSGRVAGGKNLHLSPRNSNRNSRRRDRTRFYRLIIVILLLALLIILGLLVRRF